MCGASARDEGPNFAEKKALKHDEGLIIANTAEKFVPQDLGMGVCSKKGAKA